MMIRILEEMDEKGLGSLLQGQNGMRLPAQPHSIRPLRGDKVRGDLAHETRKGELPNQQV